MIIIMLSQNVRNSIFTIQYIHMFQTKIIDFSCFENKMFCFYAQSPKEGEDLVNGIVEFF